MEAKRGIAGWKSAFSPFTNNRISGHEDRIKQGQAMYGTADLGLGICRRRGIGGYSFRRGFLSGRAIDLGNQHLDRTPQ